MKKSIFLFLILFALLPFKILLATTQDELDNNSNIDDKCNELVVQQMLDEHPKMETDEITRYRIDHDRGCYHEAGCMKGVEDPIYKPQYDYCNKIYYNKCLSEVRKTVSSMIEEEKAKRINDCVELFSNSSIDEYIDTNGGITTRDENGTDNINLFVYKNTDLHYAFALPLEWAEIPPAEIKRITDYSNTTAGTQVFNYATGFYISDRQYYDPPTILVQHQKIETPSYKQITKSINEFDFSQEAEKVDSRTENIKHISIDKPVIDKERNIIFMAKTIEQEGGGKAKILIANFLGKRGIVQITFQSLESEYDDYIPVFENIINSFEFDAGYEYDPIIAMENNKGTLNNTIITALSGGVAAFFIIFIRHLFRKNRQLNNKRAKT